MRDHDPGRGEYPGAPGWVKTFTAVFVVLVAIALVIVIGSALGLHTPMGHGG